MKILLSAYCCSPNSGSEQGYGWWWVKKCAEIHDVTVITCKAQKQAIEKYLRKNNTGSINFVFVRGPKKVSSSGTAYRFERIRQYLWQIKAIGCVRKLTRREKFNVAQHITIGTWRLPSCLAFCSVPFILGPISGSEKLPPGFLKRIGIKGAIWEKIRELMILLARFDPLVRTTLRRADLILTAGPATYTYMKSKFPTKTFSFTRAFPNPKIEKLRFLNHKKNQSEKYFRLSWMGRLIPRKGFEILLEALVDPRLTRCKLVVIGDGANRRRYVNLALKLGIENRVNFLGHLDQQLAFETLCENDIFIFTSLQDMMGQSLSEAMQIGMPCIVMDWSGPAWLAGQNGAYKVPVSNYKETIKDLANAIYKLKNDVTLRNNLKYSSLERINSLTNPINFEKKINTLYEKAIVK